MKNKEIESIKWLTTTPRKKGVVNMAAKVIDDILIVDFSERTVGKFFRLVLTRTNYKNYFPSEVKIDRSYRTCNFNSGWNTRVFDHIIGCEGVFYTHKVECSEETQKVIFDYTGIQGKYYSAFSALEWYERQFVRKKNERAYNKKEAARKAKVAFYTGILKEPPKKFLKWAEKKFGQHILRIEPFKGREESTAHCSCCGTFPIEKGEYKKCPKCGSKVTVKRTNIQGNFITSREVIYMELHDNMIYKRIFDFTEQIFEDKETYSLNEKCLDVFNGTSRLSFYKKYYGWWDSNSLYDDHIIIKGDGVIYNIKEVLKDERFKYSGIEYLENVDPINYLSRYLVMPQLEMLAKIGLTNLAKEITQEDFSKDYKKPWEMLGVDKVRFNRMIKTNPTWCGLLWYQADKGDDDDIKFFSAYNVTPKEIEFAKEFMTIKKIHNYLESQNNSGAVWASYYGNSIKSILSTWRDYLDMCRNMGRDTSLELVYKPKNLKCAHDDLASVKMANDREKEILERFPNANEVISELKKYEFEADGYAIVAPESIKDIVREGRILGHCLDRTDIYFDRICRHESFILFLRKTSDITSPYYSLEVEPDTTTRQKRTYGDKQNADYKDCVKFITKWQRTMKKKLSKEDKEYAKESARLREENFRELRENQTKVWHGVCAGQFLADVLEADLMLA